MNHIFCIHSSVAGHLVLFPAQLLAITDKASMNIVEYMSLMLKVENKKFMKLKRMVSLDMRLLLLMKIR